MLKSGFKNLVLAAALLGVLTSFEGWPFPILLFVHYWLTARPRRKAAWLLPLMTLLGLALQAGHVALLLGFGHLARDSAAAPRRRRPVGAGGASPALLSPTGARGVSRAAAGTGR